MPFGGYFDGSSYVSAGTNANYWSSTLSSTKSKAYIAYTPNSGAIRTNGTVDRCLTEAIRPVYVPSSKTINGHEYVDLGLPSGTLWATCNVGANKPEDYGNYYAWGETETKSYYNWDNYKYVADGAPDQLTKYCNRYNYGNNGFTDNKTSLLTSDDPAAKWGSGWRTPSKVQWDELLKYTTSKWTIQNGVKGRLFTSKNGQTIFLPAAGNYYSKPYKEGEEGIYWSRSIGNNGLAPRHSWYLFFKADRCEVDGNDRCYGHTVRPVR